MALHLPPVAQTTDPFWYEMWEYRPVPTASGRHPIRRSAQPPFCLLSCQPQFMINKEAYIEQGIVGEEVQTVKGGVNGRIDFPADGEFSCSHSNSVEMCKHSRARQNSYSNV